MEPKLKFKLTFCGHLHLKQYPPYRTSLTLQEVMSYSSVQFFTL